MVTYSTYPFGDFHWKAPVATLGDLPASGNTVGDVRVVTASNTEYVWTGSAWTAISGGGGGGTGTPNTFSGYDNLGNAGTIPGWGIDTTSGGMNVQLTEQPNGLSVSSNVHTLNVLLDPLQNSPDEQWVNVSHTANIDPNSTGFDIGTNGGALILVNNDIYHHGTSDVGRVSLMQNTFSFGNGTDPISVKGIGYSFGFGGVNAGVTVTDYIQGYGFQPAVDPAATLDSASYISAFYDNANIGCATPSYTSFGASPIIASINNNTGYNAFNSNPNITTLTGNAGVNCFAASGTIGTINTGSLNGLNFSPTVTLNKGYVAGVNVNMDNITNYAGVQASLVIQDITYTFIQAGAGNNSYQIEYLDDTTAGNESFTIAGFLVSCHMESGVSTATQIAAAAAANLSFAGAVTTTITGTPSNTQVAAAAANFTGGINAGTKQAGYFKGDVQIDGALSFSGGLSIGALSSFATHTMTSGSGSPYSIDTLITSPSVPASATLTGADLLAVNTAMLLTVGASASVSTGFLGVTALGLPAVVNMGSGSTVDRVGGAVFAISLDGAAGGGTIAEVDLCRSLAIPNGITTVSKLKGYYFDLPFGDPGTQTWGIYMEPTTAQNFMAGSVKIGGTDTVANSSVALEIESTTKALLLPRMTSAQEGALTAVNGMMIYNTDTNKFRGYAGGAWVDLN